MTKRIRLAARNASTSSTAGPSSKGRSAWKLTAIATATAIRGAARHASTTRSRELSGSGAAESYRSISSATAGLRPEFLLVPMRCGSGCSPEHVIGIPGPPLDHIWGVGRLDGCPSAKTDDMPHSGNQATDCYGRHHLMKTITRKFQLLAAAAVSVTAV